MNSGGPFLSAHKDVLEAPIPTTTDAKLRLLQELKDRGKASVQASRWPDAALLYRKAIEVVCDTGDDVKSKAEIAILNANLSLTEGKMNGWDAARTAALAATVADPSYVKGWWRLGQAQAALQKYKDAVQSLEKGMELEPTNKALQKELTKLKEKAIQAAAKDDAETKAAAEDKKKKETTSTKVSTSSEISTTTATTTKVTSQSTSAASDSKNNLDRMEIDDTTFTKSDFVKGYKIVNGKKTSYFHNELSEETKQLIGDIAPKKLDTTSTTGSTPASTTTNNTDSTTTTTSVWNQAGTWEEKDVSNWAKSNIESMLMQTSYTFPLSSPAPNAIVTITKATAKGHASVATVRGKKRYIYEYSISIHWKFEHNNNEATTKVEAEGSIQFPDVDGTCVIGEGYDASHFTITSTNDNNIRPLLETFIHQNGLRLELHKTIDDWVRLFQETY